MDNMLYMVMALVAGLFFGGIFFGGLWLTTKKALESRLPALWFFLSFFFRTGTTLIGFYYVSGGNWQQLLVCLFGFVMARYIVMRITKLYNGKQTQFKKEGYET